MPSKIQVDQIAGATGSTVTLPSGQTLDLSSGTVTLPNSAVNLTTKVTGTLPVANGGTGLTTLGSATQVLRVNSGATALEFAAVSSDFVLLATTDASASSAVSFDGYFSSTYKNYKVIISNLLVATDSQTFRMRYRQSNADVTDSYYVSSVDTSYQSSSNAATDYDGGWNASSFRLNGSSVSNSDALGNLNAEITFYNPLGTSYKKGFTCIIMSNNGTGHFNSTSSGSYTNSNAALSGVTFFNNSGNITAGNFKLYGIK
jgi:hypothetical protein